MSDLPAAQKLALEAWARSAIEAGWLTENATQALHQVTTAAPAQLFDATDRPLVAGLFGGTGVGKSTLLNRLADEPIARVSAERPTSRDITVYVHRSLSVDRLPDAFPMDRMRTALHNNEAYRHILFIDMPDFDSVESANRELVRLWLPHLDVVLYVVSPERYRDDQGWRLLLEHAQQHAWLFIMNHWDRGDPSQLEDFRQQLSSAGMDDPMIFRCDCSSESSASTDEGSTDDFAALQTTLRDLADQSIIDSLDELGVLARLRSLKKATDSWLNPLSSSDRLEALQTDWQSHWQQATGEMQGTLAHKAQQVAQGYAGGEGSWFERLRGKTRPAAPVVANPLVDEALLTRLDNILGDFLNRQSLTAGWPLPALKQAVAAPYTQARREFTDIVNDSLLQSLALPGSPWQRNLHRALGVLCVVLPLAAMGWIAWRVVDAFAAGGSNPAAYLGSNFAINGSLLLAIAWLLPAFLQARVRPSREQAARRGFQQGLTAALAQTYGAVSEAFAQLGAQSQSLRQQYQDLWQSLAQADITGLPEAVQRMLAHEVSTPRQRVLDVRANTHSSTDAAPVS